MLPLGDAARPSESAPRPLFRGHGAQSRWPHRPTHHAQGADSGRLPAGVFHRFESFMPQPLYPERPRTNRLHGRQVIALSGIGNPKPFLATLRERYEVVQEMTWRTTMFTRSAT
ncbi:MAG: hypothetical protein ACLRMJ_07330 [Alistipes finegoldii]